MFEVAILSLHYLKTGKATFLGKFTPSSIIQIILIQKCFQLIKLERDSEFYGLFLSQLEVALKMKNEVKSYNTIASINARF